MYGSGSQQPCTHPEFVRQDLVVLLLALVRAQRLLLLLL